VNDQVKEVKMGRACITHGGERFCWESQKERYYVSRNKILRWILDKGNGVYALN
jgi:hypothetical protein